MSAKSKFVKIIVPVLIIIAGLAVMKILVASRSAPSREAVIDPGILVQAIPAEKKNVTVTVKGTGSVTAAEEVSIIPQVSGRVTYAAPDLVVGGFFPEGAVLFEIEDVDYRLALDRALAAQAKAEVDLMTMESQARIARSEWDRINRDTGDPPNPLVLYEPQMKSAMAALSSAAAQVEQARIDLKRTKITSPFNARVRSESIDTGQYVRSGNSVAVLAGTDTAEIAVPLPLSELQWLDIPRYGERVNGADALVYLRLSGKDYTWKGRVVRSTGEVDPRSRMMELIVEIEDPYGLRNSQGTSTPGLATGTFVDVHITGREVRGVFEIPRTVFRDNSTVWVMDSDEKLRIKEVSPLKIERDRVLIQSGIEEGDQIVITPVSGAADGMKLRRIQ